MKKIPLPVIVKYTISKIQSRINTYAKESEIMVLNQEEHQLERVF